MRVASAPPPRSRAGARSSRGRRRPWRAALLLAGSAAALAPASAQAGTAALSAVGPAGGAPFAVDYVAAPGERNEVDVTISAADVRIADLSAQPVAGAGCTVQPGVAVCPLPAGAAALLVRVQALDGDDTIRLEGFGAQPALVAAVLDGGEGNDRLTAMTLSPAQAGRSATDPSRAYLVGGPGDDTLADGAGSDELLGGDGRDTLLGGPGDDRLAGDSARGQAILAPPIAPEQLADPLLPGAPPPVAADTLDGGPGRDEADYSDRPEPVRVDLTSSNTDGVAGEGDVLTGMEGARGGPGGAVLRGDAAANVLIGGSTTTGVADRLTGEAGDDTLIASGPKAIMAGGAGDDRLVGPEARSTCGPGFDRILAGPLPRLNAATLGKTCEALPVGPQDGLLLGTTPLRRSGATLTLSAATLPAAPRPTTATLALRRGGRTLATARRALPAGLRAGQPLTFTFRPSKAARKRLAGQRTLEVQATVPGAAGGTVTAIYAVSGT